MQEVYKLTGLTEVWLLPESDRSEGESGEVAAWATSTCTMTNGKQVTEKAIV